jgi:hypothetical protein
LACESATAWALGLASASVTAWGLGYATELGLAWVWESALATA